MEGYTLNSTDQSSGSIPRAPAKQTPDLGYMPVEHLFPSSMGPPSFIPDDIKLANIQIHLLFFSGGSSVPLFHVLCFCIEEGRVTQFLVVL